MDVKTASFETTFNASTDWWISTDCAWIHITSETEGSSGKHKLNFYIDCKGGRDEQTKGYIFVSCPYKQYSLTVQRGGSYSNGGHGSNM